MTDTQDERIKRLERALRKSMRYLPRHGPIRHECNVALAQQEPDQPADAGEYYEGEARHYDQHGCPEEAELCRQKARGDEESVANSEALTDAEEQELANMGLTNQPADAGDPSCCARTREECARVCDERAQAEQALADACDRAVETEDWFIHTDRARQLRECAAAIRCTGDTP
jgi:hypothetical protein